MPALGDEDLNLDITLKRSPHFEHRLEQNSVLNK
jgi:hypothetical protein